MTIDHRKQNVALSSVFAGFGLTVMKLIVGLLTGSMGIMSEAAHSLLDLGAAGLTYATVRVSDRPADDEHPYGHGKLESVSALVETGLLFLTSAWIIYESVHRLWSGNIEVEARWYAFVIVIIAIVIDFSRARALEHVAKETKSQALEADALHFRSDIWSSMVVFLGLIGVVFGIRGADCVAALGVACFVLVAGYRLGKRTVDVLVDAAPEGLAETVKNIAQKVPGVVAVERVRARAMGMSAFVDVVAQVDRKLSAEGVGKLVAEIQKRVHAHTPELDVVVHTIAAMAEETISQKVQVLAVRCGVAVHDIVVDRVGERQNVSYDVEVAGHVSLREAHDLATMLEQEIRHEVGESTVINSHIEPLGIHVVQSADLDEESVDNIRQEIEKIITQAPPLRNPHHIDVRRMSDKLFITLHCLSDGVASLDVVHTASGRLEYLIKDNVSNVQRVVVHVEPEEEEGHDHGGW